MIGKKDWRTLLIAGLSGLSALAAPRLARADDPRLGVDLFQSGRQLMNDGNYEKACPLLRDSQKADPQPGTLLNLALCYEKLGKTASAWSTYADLLQTGGPLQQQAAKDALKRLGPKLSRLKIELCATPSFDAAQLVVTRNGEEVGQSALGRPSPVDAGDYTIEARAPGFEKWSRAVKVGAEGDLQTVEICTLVREAAPLASSAGAAAAARNAQPTPAAAHDEARAATTPAQRNWAPVYVAGGIGIVAATLGTVFGVIASNQKSDANKQCPSQACTPAGWDKLDSAKTSADISTVSFIVAGVAAGATLFFAIKPSAHDEPEKPMKSARLGLAVLPSGVGLACGGAF
jgi:hypothetical protein